MSGSETNKVDGEISNYLNRNVDAVVLPDKLRQYGSIYSTYPPLIIDGASGTGKTQQAFALVKEHKNIIYFLMCEPPRGGFFREQEIYEKMRHLTRDYDESSFAHRVDKAIKALRENESYKDKDICSVDFLRSTTTIDRATHASINYDTEDERWVRKTESGVKGLDLLMDVVLWMCSKHVQWDGDSGLSVVPIQPEGKTSCKFQELSSQLKGIIIFLDEALPRSGPHPGGIDRLGFVRNLGRALTMRVVLAGTGATAANLISETTAGELAWIECQLLWKTMLEDDVERVVLPNLALANALQQQALISELARSRPYLVHVFADIVNNQYINSDNLAVLLQSVGAQLQSEKHMSGESKLVYLSGAFLDQVHTSPCPFDVKPAGLVRGNYFEPCAVLDLEGNPACGPQWGVSSLTSGPLRVKIYRYVDWRDKRTMWCASMEDANSEPRAGFCWDFSGVQYALLTACVQQCLAREPLLAVALSTQFRMYKKPFREALSKLYQEPSQELSGVSAHGEHILFALLQLASNYEKLTEARVGLGTFLRNTADYWTANSDDSFARGVGYICEELARSGLSGPSQVRLAAMSGTRESEFNIDGQTSKICEKYTMPWLVPACSLEALKKTVDGAPSLFDGIDIAGLVPGGRNAAFNAASYSWKKLAIEPTWEFKDVAQPEWVFAFRARTSPRYTTDEALQELKSKCLMQQERLEDEQSKCLRQQDMREGEPENKKGRWASDQSPPDKLQCHAILIAATDGHENCCEIVYSDSGTGKYLRVALLVGRGGKYMT